MIRFALFFFLLFAISPNMAQSPMQFVGGTRHLLPTVIKRGLSPASLVIRDTFAFFNRGTDPLKIHSISCHSGKFSFSKKTAPGEVGVIYFEDSLSLYGNDFEYREYNINITTNYSPFLDLRTACMVISEANSITSRIGENKVKIIQKRLPDATTYSMYEGDEKGNPIAFGSCFQNTDQKVGKWKIWNKTTKNARDTIFSHGIHIVPANIAPENIETVSLEVKQKGEWRVPLFARKKNHFEVFIEKEVDSLKIFTDSMFQTMDLTQQSLWNYPTFSLPLQKHEEDYLLINKIPQTLHYIPDTFYLVWDITHPDLVFIHEIIAISRFFQTFQARHPQVNFYFFPYEKQGCQIVLPKENQAEILAALLKEPAIESIGQMFRMSYMPGTYFITRSFMMTFAYPFEEKDKSILLNQNFSIEKEVSGGSFVVRYNQKRLDAQFLKAVNAISSSPKVQKCHIGFINPVLSPHVMDAE